MAGDYINYPWNTFGNFSGMPADADSQLGGHEFHQDTSLCTKCGVYAMDFIRDRHPCIGQITFSLPQSPTSSSPDLRDHEFGGDHVCTRCGMTERFFVIHGTRCGEPFMAASSRNPVIWSSRDVEIAGGHKFTEAEIPVCERCGMFFDHYRMHQMSCSEVQAAIEASKPKPAAPKRRLMLD